MLDLGRAGFFLKRPHSVPAAQPGLPQNRNIAAAPPSHLFEDRVKKIWNVRTRRRLARSFNQGRNA